MDDKEELAKRYIEGYTAGQVKLARFILDREFTEVADYAWILAKLRDIADNALNDRKKLV